MVTAEEKTNRYGSHYVYYHCSKRQLIERCRQPSVERGKLEHQIARFLKTISLPQDVSEIVAATARSEYARDEEAVESARVTSLSEALRKVNAQLSELTDLRVRALIDDEEFLQKRQKLEHDRLRLSDQLTQAQAQAIRFEPLEDVISFSNKATAWFLHKNPQTQRLILETAGSNLFLRDKELIIEARKPFVKLSKLSQIPDLRGRREAIRTLLSNTDEVERISVAYRLLKKKFEDEEAIERTLVNPTSASNGTYHWSETGSTVIHRS
jgi:site-specific DNA recombinase